MGQNFAIYYYPIGVFILDHLLTFRPFASKREYQLYYKFIFCAGLKTVLPAVLSIGFTVKLIKVLRVRQEDNDLCVQTEMQLFRSHIGDEEEEEEATEVDDSHMVSVLNPVYWLRGTFGPKRTYWSCKIDL